MNKAIPGVRFGDGKNDDGLTDVQTEFTLVDFCRRGRVEIALLVR